MARRIQVGEQKTKLVLVDTQPRKRPHNANGNYSGKENEITIAAFEYWYDMGEKRSYGPVAKRFDVHYMTIANWSRKYRWKRKATERNAQISARLQESSIVFRVRAKRQYADALGELVEKYLKIVREREVAAALEGKTYTPICDVSDMERVIKLQLLLAGEATDRKENVMVNGERQLGELLRADKESRSLLAELYERAKVLSLPAINEK